MQVWHFSDASGSLAQSVPDTEVGRFVTDKAYVVLAPAAEDGNGQQRLFLWAGTDALPDTKTTAAKHAGELMKTLDASYLRQQQGQEAEEFKQLFASFTVVEATPTVEDPVTEAVPPPVSPGPDAAATPAADTPAAPTADGAAAPAAEEEAEEEAGGAADGAAAAGGKKKKKKNKKKGGAAGEAAVAAGEATSTEEAEAAAEPEPEAEPAKEQEEKSPAASPVTAAVSPAAAAAPATPAEPAHPTPTKPNSPKLSVEDKPQAPASVAKAKEQLKERLSETLSDPLGKKQQQQQKGSPSSANGKPNTTFAAESAKAWGGVGGGAPAPAPTGEVKVKPGDKTFGHDELKELRVDSGIDVACKEAYLTETEFAKVFGKDRAAFKAQPLWRQQMAKKNVGLF